MKRIFLLGVVGVLGCGAAEPLGDHAGADEDIGEIGAPVSCNPTLARYPVAGPHNGGYDANALAYTCPVHPGGSPDNSDYIGGQHFGNDLFGAKGTPIVAPVSGSIVKAGWDTTGGNRVTVQDGCGWHYYHAHLATIAVGVGQKVNAGDVIGTLGNTGSAQGTSPHLHFSIYPEAYGAGIDPFPHLQAVDGTSCGCKPHCEGSKIVGNDCGVGDCGVYGATCVDDAKGVRCASVFCPAQGQKKVCVSDKLIGDCNDGAIGVGDCSVYGAGCVDDAKGARCVVVFCLDEPAKAHDVCIPDGSLGHCGDKGALSVEKCPSSAPCSAASGSAQCGGGSAGSGGAGGEGAGGSGSGGTPGGGSKGGAGGTSGGAASGGVATGGTKASGGAQASGGAHTGGATLRGGTEPADDSGCSTSPRRSTTGLAFGVAALAWLLQRRFSVARRPRRSAWARCPR